MTPKQEAFVREYLVDLSAKDAAIRAGYSVRIAKQRGWKLLQQPAVVAAIAQSMRKREVRTEITADRVLKELARIAFFDIRKLYREDGSLKSPTELDDDTAAALVGIDIQETVSAQESGPIITTRKAKVIDRTGALTLAMRHLGMLNDKLEVNDITDRAAQMRAARAKRLGQG